MSASLDTSLGDWYSYQQFEQSYVTVESETLSWLLKAEAILDAFMKRGIHLWDGYDECMLEINKGKE